MECESEGRHKRPEKGTQRTRVFTQRFFSAVLLLILYTSLSGQRTHRVDPENCRKWDCLRC